MAVTKREPSSGLVPGPGDGESKFTHQLSEVPTVIDTAMELKPFENLQVSFLTYIFNFQRNPIK